MGTAASPLPVAGSTTRPMIVARRSARISTSTTARADRHVFQAPGVHRTVRSCLELDRILTGRQIVQQKRAVLGNPGLAVKPGLIRACGWGDHQYRQPRDHLDRTWQDGRIRELDVTIDLAQAVIEFERDRPGRVPEEMEPADAGGVDGRADPRALGKILERERTVRRGHGPIRGYRLGAEIEKIARFDGACPAKHEGRNDGACDRPASLVDNPAADRPYGLDGDLDCFLSVGGAIARSRAPASQAGRRRRERTD